MSVWFIVKPSLNEHVTIMCSSSTPNNTLVTKILKNHFFKPCQIMLQQPLLDHQLPFLHLLSNTHVTAIYPYRLLAKWSDNLQRNNKKCQKNELKLWACKIKPRSTLCCKMEYVISATFLISSLMLIQCIIDFPAFCGNQAQNLNASQTTRLFISLSI